MRDGHDEQRERQLAVAADLGRLALEIDDEAQLRDLVAKLAADGLGVPLTAVLRLAGTGLELVAGVGWDDARGGTRLLTSDPSTFAGYTLSVDEAVVSEDLAAESRFPGRDALLDSHWVASGVNVVVRMPGRRYGVLGAYATTSRRFSDDDVLFLRKVANILGAALGRADTMRVLRERELEARLAFEVGRIGSWHWDTVSGRGSWSPELEELIGLEPGSFDGSAEAFVAPILPEDRPMLHEVVQSAGQDRHEFAVQYRVRRSDGAIRWIETRGAPLGDGAEWVGVSIDVTELRGALDALECANRELEESVARLDTLLEHAPLGFAFLDSELRFAGLNEPFAELDGLPVDAHLGRRFEEVLPDLWDTVETIARQVAVSGEAVRDVEVSGQTPADPGAERHWLAGFFPVRGPDRRVLGIGQVVVDITERKRHERAARLTAAASELVAIGPELDAILQRGADLTVPELADSCVVTLFARGSFPRHVVIAHVDLALAERMRDAEGRTPLDTQRILRSYDATRQGGALLVRDVSPELRAAECIDDEQRVLAEEHGTRSTILVPLCVRDQTIGSLSLSYTHASGRSYRPDDVPLAEEIARRIAVAVESAYLAQEAERAEARLDLLAEVSGLLTVDLDSQARMEAVTRIVLPTFADVCTVHLLDGDELHLVALGARDPETQAAFEEHAPFPPSPLTAELPTTRAVRSGAPVLVGDVPEDLFGPMMDDPGGRELVRRAAVRSLLVVPLHDTGGPMGAISFAFSGSGRRYDDRDVGLGIEIARRVAPALENAIRFEREAAIAEALQRSLLPERLPEIDGASMAARYVPSGEGVRIGGDWYDVIPLRDGRIVLAIGDVVGHGIRAAAAMGKLRNLLQFCALDGLDPGAALARLNAYFCSLPDADMATVLVAEYDPMRGTLCYANAGHPPALLRHADGSPELLMGGRGMPLCASESTSFGADTVALEPGSVLVLYTDGLIERRGESLDVGFERLEGAVHDLPPDVDVLADELLARLLAGPTTSDDVAVLVMRPVLPTLDLDLRFAAAPRELARLRRSLGEWLRRVGADDREAPEILVAVNEAAANAVEHAYGLVDAEFTVRAGVRDGTVDIEVRDRGRWRPHARRGDRGRGIALARGLMDEVVIEPAEDGTRVRLTRRLRAPVNAGERDRGAAP